MNILLVVNKGSDRDIKIMVKVHTKTLKEKVFELLNNDREKEAFDLIVSKAQVTDFIPPGIKISKPVAFTLVEDLL